MERDQRWQGIVSELTDSFGALQESTAGAASLTGERFDTLLATKDIDTPEAADRYLRSSVAARRHLAERLTNDREARDLLAQITSVDFQAADLLLAAADEPEIATVEFHSASGAKLNVGMLREQLMGLPGLEGAQANPDVMVDVTTACNEVLSIAGDRLQEVGRAAAGAVTVTSLLDSFSKVVDFQFSPSFRSAAASVTGAFKKLKEWALRVIEEAITKIAGWLGIDAATIKGKLNDVWGSVTASIEDHVADLLGRAHALAAWTAHMGAIPPPTREAIDRGRAAVDHSRRTHEEHLRFVGYANQVYKRISKGLAAWTQGGPLVVVLIAAALTGWITWAAWDHLGDVGAAAA